MKRVLTVLLLRVFMVVFNKFSFIPSVQGLEQKSFDLRFGNVIV